MAADPSTFEGLRPLLIIDILLSQNLVLANNILNEILRYNWHLVRSVWKKSALVKKYSKLETI